MQGSDQQATKACAAAGSPSTRHASATTARCACRHGLAGGQEAGQLPSIGAACTAGRHRSSAAHHASGHQHQPAPLACRGHVVQVAPEALTLLANEAMRDVAHLLRPGHLQQLRNIMDDPEASPNDKVGGYACIVRLHALGVQLFVEGCWCASMECAHALCAHMPCSLRLATCLPTRCGAWAWRSLPAGSHH